MKVDIQVEEPYRAQVDLPFVRNAAAETLRALPKAAALPLAALTIRFTGDEPVRILNREYLGVDAPTDVLSFPSGEAVEDRDEVYLGDMIISVECAARQAEQGGHALSDEITLLTVHGVLHLLGHDHADAEQKAQMWAVQAAVLKRLGCSLSPP